MKRNDWIIILIIAVAAGCVYLFTRLSSQTAESEVMQANIYFDGDLYESVFLDDTQDIVIDTEYGHNVVRVENGMVVMSEADCPDGLCLQSGGIDSVYQNIVCLPNKVHVEIIGGEEEAQVDVISQ